MAVLCGHALRFIMRKWICGFAALMMLFSACSAEELSDFYNNKWQPHDGFGGVEIETKGDYTYAFEYGEASWGYEPPYRTTVFDAEGKKLFSVEGYFPDNWNSVGEGSGGLKDGMGVVWMDSSPEQGIVWGVVSENGEMLMEDLEDISDYEDGYIYYSRDFGIPLLDRLFDKFDIKAGLCGRFNLAGDRLELVGSYLSPPDEEGYMILKPWGWDSILNDSDRFGYVDETGKAAISCTYERAYPFVDGAAVVKKAGCYMLIDPEGEEICEISRTWAGGAGYLRAFEAPVLPIDRDGGLVLINRRGEVINETPFAAVYANVFANLNADIMQCEDAEGIAHFVDAEGRVLFSKKIENTLWRSLDPDVLWVQEGELWGRLDVKGAYGKPGEYTSQDRYRTLDSIDESFIGQLPDGSWVKIGEMGQALEKTDAPVDPEYWK